jgi:hypothetical protein
MQPFSAPPMTMSDIFGRAQPWGETKNKCGRGAIGAVIVAIVVAVVVVVLWQIGVIPSGSGTQSGASNASSSSTGSATIVLAPRSSSSGVGHGGFKGPGTLDEPEPGPSVIASVLAMPPQIFYILNETSDNSPPIDYSARYFTTPLEYVWVYQPTPLSSGTSVLDNGVQAGVNCGGNCELGPTYPVGLDSTLRYATLFGSHWALEAWFNAGTGGCGGLVQLVWDSQITQYEYTHYDYGSSDGGAAIYIAASGQVAFGVNPGAFDLTPTEINLVSPNSYHDGNNHYAAATYDPSAGVALYVDGALVASSSSVVIGASTVSNNYKLHWEFLWWGSTDYPSYGGACPHQALQGDSGMYAVYMSQPSGSGTVNPELTADLIAQHCYLGGLCSYYYY